jgi:hypothetical protein
MGIIEVGKYELAQKERFEFSERLISSLKNSNIPVRVVELRKLFLQHNKTIPLSAHAIRKWLLGESIPTQEKLRVLADILSVEPNWLRYGEAINNDEKPNFNKLNSNQKKLLNEFEKLSSNQKIYIIEITEALAAKDTKI